jgi:hypothetical protein
MKKVSWVKCIPMALGLFVLTGANYEGCERPEPAEETKDEEEAEAEEEAEEQEEVDPCEEGSHLETVCVALDDTADDCSKECYDECVPDEGEEEPLCPEGTEETVVCAADVAGADVGDEEACWVECLPLEICPEGSYEQTYCALADGADPAKFLPEEAECWNECVAYCDEGQHVEEVCCSHPDHEGPACELVCVDDEASADERAGDSRAE